MALKIIHTKNLRWVDIVNPADEEITYLKNNFRFHPLDFEDVVTPSTRPKIDEYDGYHFIILLFPVFNKDSREIKPAEVDFFIGPDYVVTIHDGTMKTLTNLVHNVHQYDNVRNQNMGQGPGYLLFSILELLFKRSFPILDHINHDLDQAGKNIFELDIETLQKLARLKKNIIIYRRIMKMHKFVLSKLMRSKRTYMAFKDSKLYFQNLIEYAENIWDVLQSDKETTDSYEETNQSLAAHKMNDILRVLTIFSVIIFLLTLIINILLFAESTTRISDLPNLLPLSLMLLCTITLVMLHFFKKRNWL
ncbi:MAG TPA: CorA family divalent cation transporter [Patescibacteria group bacterium]|jgi:magnesium transporter|nr:CorA family divalent cation transporter [Patescibacteria group bacterium]